jgi:hypothetical protein
VVEVPLSSLLEGGVLQRLQDLPGLDQPRCHIHVPRDPRRIRQRRSRALAPEREIDRPPRIAINQQSRLRPAERNGAVMFPAPIGLGGARAHGL